MDSPRAAASCPKRNTSVSTLIKWFWLWCSSLVSLQRCVSEEMKNRCRTCTPPRPQMGAMFAPILHPRSRGSPTVWRLALEIFLFFHACERGRRAMRHWWRGLKKQWEVELLSRSIKSRQRPQREEESVNMSGGTSWEPLTTGFHIMKNEMLFLFQGISDVLFRRFYFPLN